MCNTKVMGGKPWISEVSHCMHQKLQVAYATGLMTGVQVSGLLLQEQQLVLVLFEMQFSSLCKCNPVCEYRQQNILQSLFILSV